MTTTIEHRYKIGQIVYLRTDVEQLPWMVTILQVTPNGVCYELSQGMVSNTFWEHEISAQRQTVLMQ